MKTCERCGQEKAPEAFYRRRTSPGGGARTCLDCGSKYNGPRSARRKDRVAVDPEYAAKVAAWGRDSKRRARDDRYGVPEGTVDAMFVAQAGVCAVCRRSADEVGMGGRNGERLHVDHDHRTGVVRGLLCKKCNSALGLLDDDVDRLMALAAYLLATTDLLSVGV